MDNDVTICLVQQLKMIGNDVTEVPTSPTENYDVAGISFSPDEIEWIMTWQNFSVELEMSRL